MNRASSGVSRFGTASGQPFEAPVPRLRALYKTLLMLDDTPRRIALGMAVGLFIAWTPTVGIQTVIAIFATWLMRANRVAGVIGVYLSNPLTVLPMYWLDYRLGAMVLQERLTFQEFRAMIELGGWYEWGQTFLTMGRELVVPMCLGGLILGAGHAVGGYWLTHWLICRFRRSDAGTVGVIRHGPSAAAGDTR